jgi:hypothetical protein
MNLDIRRNRLARWIRAQWAPAPVRPIVVIQSDDWGRTGTPDAAALSELRDSGFPIGDSPWDYYGLESAQDLHELGTILGQFRDQENQPACMVANFILANPDLRRMRSTDWREIHWVEIKQGLPAPWNEPGLHQAYDALINAGVFRPALHGYSHFNEAAWSEALHQPKTDLGKRTRALAEHDIPYLASLTPEFNFALVVRHGARETFRPEHEQALWVQNSVRAYCEMFGHSPISTCAPGYRSNFATDHCWQQASIQVVQTAERCLPYYRCGLLVLPRNVFFEPVFSDSDAVDLALESAEAAVSSGLPVVICSHSINYMERHLKRAAYGRAALSSLLNRLLARFPNLRFAHDANVYDTYTRHNPEWWRKPTGSEVNARRKLGFC